jgi:hypothetical protein
MSLCLPLKTGGPIKCHPSGTGNVETTDLVRPSSVLVIFDGLLLLRRSLLLSPLARLSHRQ